MLPVPTIIGCCVVAFLAGAAFAFVEIVLEGGFC
jgi:hypothetical protein